MEYFTREEASTTQNNNIFAVADVESRGMEFELNYNPTRFWTLKFNATQTEALDKNISADTQQWIDERLPVWQSIIDPQLNRPWFTERYGGTQSAQEFLNNSVLAPLNIAKATEGKSRPQIRKYRFNLSTSYRLAGLSENRWLKAMTVGGALRWEDKAAIGYYGVEKLPAIITALDPFRPIYEKARAYGDLFVAYRTRLFSNKVGTTFQLNVRNVQENGRLQGHQRLSRRHAERLPHRGPAAVHSHRDVRAVVRRSMSPPASFNRPRSRRMRFFKPLPAGSGYEFRLITYHPPPEMRRVETPPVWPPRLKARPANETQAWVLAHAGARPWERDAIDRRLIEEARSGGGKIINFESEVGGPPRSPQP